jgi:DNA-binding SARP family transcriptional activator/TolB-like protein
LAVLGPFAASINGKPVRLSTRKAQALVAYLALGDPAGESRERMVGLLWSESDSKRARDSLRQAIKEVNDALLEAGFAGFHPGKQILSLVRSLVVTDLDAVMASATEGRVHERLLDTQRLADTLLVSLEAVDASFQVWVRAKRHALHDRLTMTLENVLPADAAAGGGAEIAQALLNLDPTHEVGCRHLMCARIARGEIGGALKAYKALWDVLEQDYDIEPSQETQDLVVRIKQQTGWSARPGDAADPRLAGGVVSVPAPPAARRPQRLFIAVKPFNVDGVPEQLRSTVNGFRHELVASLARFREWSVRTLAADAKAHVASEGSPTEYIFDATAYGRPEEMRLIVTLADGNHEIVWGDQFTLQVSDLLASQQRIVRSMAVGLKINLSADRQRRLTSESDLNKELHDAWLRGQDLLHGLNPKDWRTAQDLFEILTKEAPDFSPAFSSMVQLNNTRHIVFPGVFRDLKEHAATLLLAQRAAHLDPQDSRAQLGVAWAHQLVGRATEAGLHADLAVELNPNDPWTLIAAAQIHAYCGAYTKAVALCTQSIKLTPDPTPTQRSYSSAIFFLAGMYRESVDMAIEGIDPSPAFAIWRCASLAQLERVAEARELMQRTVELIKVAWDGSSPASDRIIWRWLLHMFPIAVMNDWERLRLSLVAAGAPAEEERFGQW